MGCMYPNSIRTESIESMECPECRFQCSNIDEEEKEVSKGILQLTDKDLIYFRPGGFPTRWPLNCIRRYGYNDEKNIFVFFAGRLCPTGEAIFAFRLKLADLVKLRENIERYSPNESRTENQCEVQPVNVDHHNNSIKDPKPLSSYALIDFNTSKALIELIQAHAANRTR